MTTPEIDALKHALDVETDLEMAAKLGLSRSAVAQWRRRGAIPARFRRLLEAERTDTYLETVRQQIFRKPEYHYWLRAALALATPAGAIAEAGDASAAERRERLILHLMALAMTVTRKDLGLSRIASETAWNRLMNRLLEAYSPELEALLREHGS